MKEKFNSSVKYASLAIIITNTIWLATPAYAADEITPVAANKAQFLSVYQYRHGDMQITALSDGTVPQDLYKLLLNTNAAEIKHYLAASFRENPVETSINVYLIDTGNRLILIDTGAGSLFGPGKGGKLLGNLKAAGYTPEQITDILLTHIHTDHSGGLSIDGKMLFPNATIHVSQADVDFFLDPSHQQGIAGYDKHYFTGATQTVKPYLDAGRIQTFNGKTQILPGVLAAPVPGHTPGHSFYLIESKGNTICFIGDLIHNSDIQFQNAGVGIVYDVDKHQAVSERKKQLATLSQSHALIAGAHLPYPGLGHIRHEGNNKYSFISILYKNR